MTQQPWSAGPQHNPWSPQPPAGYPPYPPATGYPVDPAAPYGRHPVTGQPLSDKSKVSAAALQLIGLLGFLGFGRIYLGQVGLGIAQLLIGLLLTVTTFGYGIAVPTIWGIVDAILILTGRVSDPQGRPLRDRT